MGTLHRTVGKTLVTVFAVLTTISLMMTLMCLKRGDTDGAYDWFWSVVVDGSATFILGRVWIKMYGGVRER